MRVMKINLSAEFFYFISFSGKENLNEKRNNFICTTDGNRRNSDCGPVSPLKEAKNEKKH